jgi:hypothetical protein
MVEKNDHPLLIRACPGISLLYCHVPVRFKASPCGAGRAGDAGDANVGLAVAAGALFHPLPLLSAGVRLAA